MKPITPEEFDRIYASSDTFPYAPYAALYADWQQQAEELAMVKAELEQCRGADRSLLSDYTKVKARLEQALIDRRTDRSNLAVAEQLLERAKPIVEYYWKYNSKFVDLDTFHATEWLADYEARVNAYDGLVDEYKLSEIKLKDGLTSAEQLLERAKEIFDFFKDDLYNLTGYASIQDWLADYEARKKK